MPESLKNKRLVAIDLGTMIAGAKYRGEFEDRLKAFLKEIAAAQGQIIFFIDELHTLVGAGKTEGSAEPPTGSNPSSPAANSVAVAPSAGFTRMGVPHRFRSTPAQNSAVRVNLKTRHKRTSKANARTQRRVNAAPPPL